MKHEFLFKMKRLFSVVLLALFTAMFTGCSSDDEEYIGWRPTTEGWCKGPDKMGWFDYTASENYFSGKVYGTSNDTVSFVIKNMPTCCDFVSYTAIYTINAGLNKGYVRGDIIYFKLKRFKFIPVDLSTEFGPAPLSFVAVIETVKPTMMI